MTIRSMGLAALTAALLATPLVHAQAAPETDPAGSRPEQPVGDAPPMTPAQPAPPPAAPAPAAPVASTDETLTKLYGESASFKTFLADLQKATAAEDKKAVAKMVKYPFKTKVDGQDKTFEKEADLVKAYDTVFTAKVLTAIKDQSYDKLFANEMGVMIGSGQVWFAKSGEDVKIIAVNQNAGA